MRYSVWRRGPGRYRVKLTRNEERLVRSLLAQMREQLEASTDEPHLRRLFPPAYPNDPERDAGYQVMTRDELLDRRLKALEIVERTVGGGELDQAELSAWMLTLNAMRLVLGTRLDVDEELPDLDPDDPHAFAYAVYHHLGILLEQVVEALGEDVPPPPPPTSDN